MTVRTATLAAMIATLALAACAGQPTQTEQARAASPVPAAAGTATPAQTPVISGAIDPKQLVAMQHAGYRLVNRNGQTLYCEINAKTGTRIARDPVCLTEEELRQLRERTQQNMDSVTRQLAPPQGR